MGLGTAGDRDVTLAEARDLADDARKKLRQRIDPLEAKRAGRLQKSLEAAKAMTFRQ